MTFKRESPNHQVANCTLVSKMGDPSVSIIRDEVSTSVIKLKGIWKTVFTGEESIMMSVSQVDDVSRKILPQHFYKTNTKTATITLLAAAPLGTFDINMGYNITNGHLVHSVPDEVDDFVEVDLRASKSAQRRIKDIKTRIRRNKRK